MKEALRISISLKPFKSTTMKTKTMSKQRTQARDYDVAMIDCKSEFCDGVFDDSILDELAMAEIDDLDD